MKLEKYLANYLLQEDKEQNVPIMSEDYLERFIRQGLDAFESTKNVKIEIHPAERICHWCGKHFTHQNFKYEKLYICSKNCLEEMGGYE